MPRRGGDDRGGQELHAALGALARLVPDDVGVHGADVAFRRRGREELHPALRALARLVAHDVRVHRAGIDDRALGRAQVQLGHERQRLVGRCVQVGGEPLALVRPFGVVPQHAELLVERRRGGLGGDLDRRERVCAPGCPVLERQPAGLVEEDVDDDPLRRREHDRVDELLALVPPAVAADELHARPRERDVEHPRVRGVREIEADDLALSRAQPELRLAADEHHVPEPAHRRVRRLRRAERGDRALLEQHVVERQGELAVRRRPIVLVRRDDDDVPVQAELLAVVLADVGVVPVDAGIGELDAIRERPADRDRRLCLVRPVVAVVEPQSVPMHGRLEVAVVRDVDDELGALAHAQRRAGNRAVVREHAHRRVPDPLRDRADPQVDRVAVAEVDHLCGDRLG